MWRADSLEKTLMLGKIESRKKRRKKRRKEKRRKDEIVGWHHRLNGHSSEQTPGDNEGHGRLVYCKPWGCKESDKTKQHWLCFTFNNVLFKSSLIWPLPSPQVSFFTVFILVISFIWTAIAQFPWLPWHCHTHGTQLTLSASSRCWFPVTGCSTCMLSWFSHVWLFSTLWILAYQTPLSMGFSRHEYWTGLPCPPPGNLPDPGIKPASLMSPALHVGSLPLVLPRKPD